ncbi:MAG: large conductance mechanosensitive channel protein MscL [Defluviitaleaceae bacterium]|nr:large conductance mechanosensitive channel protein MscL [Defluviitaleaceae bacterium]
MKKFLQEFKEFALRGNAMSLAVGMLIGLGFQGVVASLTDDILSPLIGLVAGQNFDSLEINILGATLRYGAFVTALINFIIMALVVFLLIRAVNKLFSTKTQKQEAQAPPQRLCPFCMTQLHQKALRCPACTSQL